MYVMKNIFYFIIIFVCNGYLQAQQAPAKLWDKTFGGNNDDNLLDIISTPDGGYLLGGYSWSGISGDVSQENRGRCDYWVVKVDQHFNKIWDKRFGGSEIDELFSVVVSPDGGYLLGGHSFSPISGDKSDINRGDRDFWIVKIDEQGEKIWDKTFGGFHIDYFNNMIALPEDGYLLAGWSRSGINIDKSEPNKGGADFWVIKINNQGEKIWDRTFGGNNNDYLNTIKLSKNGNYILTGGSASGISGDRNITSLGGTDCWLLEIDPQGNIVWQQVIGGQSNDLSRRLIVDPDGNLIFGGWSTSGISDDKSEDNRGRDDYWVVKSDPNGNKIWDKTLGGSQEEFLFSRLVRTPDGGILVGGQSRSGISFDKSESNRGDHDTWIVKLDENGNQVWDKTLGGSQFEILSNIIITPDNGYLLGCTSASDINEDKNTPNKGGRDFWLVSMDAEIDLPPVVSNPLVNLSLSGCELSPINIDLSNLFDDPNDDNNSIIKSIANPNEVTRLSPTINGNTLQLNPIPGNVETIELVIEGLSDELTTYDTVEVFLNIQPIPQPKILGNSTFCEGNPGVFTVEPQPGHEYFWQIIPDDDPVQTRNNTTQIELNWAGQSGKIVLIDSLIDISCVGYDTLEIQSFQTKIALPEMFSPNRDGQNDHFHVLLPDQSAPVQDIDIKIYDYNGWTVYQSQNIEEAIDSQRGWDGGNYPSGIYIYVLKLGFRTCEKQITLKGAVKLLR